MKTTAPTRAASPKIKNVSAPLKGTVNNAKTRAASVADDAPIPAAANKRGMANVVKSSPGRGSGAKNK